MENAAGRKTPNRGKPARQVPRPVPAETSPLLPAPAFIDHEKAILTSDGSSITRFSSFPQRNAISLGEYVMARGSKGTNRESRKIVKKKFLLGLNENIFVTQRNKLIFAGARQSHNRDPESVSVRDPFTSGRAGRERLSIRQKHVRRPPITNHHLLLTYEKERVISLLSMGYSSPLPPPPSGRPIPTSQLSCPITASV